MPAAGAPSAGPAWHALAAEDVLTRTGSAQAGLSSQEAAARLADQGRNQLIEGESIRPHQILLNQFKGLIIWILLGAGVVSGLLGEWLDCAAILAIVLLNAALGFYQEFKAGRSIAALRHLTAPQAAVLRDGQALSTPASDVVQGDVLLLEAGTLVAADARVLASASLRCVESALTGEAKAVNKQAATLAAGEIALGDRANMVFMGTGVAAGTGRAVVVATAMGTELGRIASLLEAGGKEEKTPLQRRLDALGRGLVWATLAIVALLFGLGLRGGAKLPKLFMGSISLAVAAIPEGLPAIVTVVLALGSLRLSRRRALVRRLPAVETLGSTSVICTDKTGTLTVGAMTVRALVVAGQRFDVAGEGYGPDGGVSMAGHPPEAPFVPGLLELASVLLGCNNAQLVQKDGAWSVLGDPTEGALMAAGLKAGGTLEGLDRDRPVQAAFPFDSDRKRGSVVRRMADGSRRAFVNGAPGAVLDLCDRLYTRTGIRPMTEEDRQGIRAETTAMAEQALRVLGSAHRVLDASAPLTQEAVERDLVFVGLSGMYDPPRPEAKAAVATCRLAGIRVVMITGDHPVTAASIARELGLAHPGEAAVSGPELDRMSAGDLQARVSSISVYARVTAEHKLRIVQAWQANAAVVAMTGDGVNDAPAIQGADIGIAMGMTGTEVTKQAADLIVTDDNFASIVTAVEEGRGINDNIRKTLQYLLAGNTGELLLMTACVCMGLPSPLLPIQLLWINLVTDGLPALCLATDPIDPKVMDRPPRARSASFTDRGFLWTMGLTGLLTGGVALAAFLLGLREGSPAVARTYAFSVLVFAELLRSFGARSDTRPIWRIPFFTNPNLALVVGVSMGLQAWILSSPAFGRFLKTPPIPLAHALWLVLASFIPMAALEGVKVVRNARKGKPGAVRMPQAPGTAGPDVLPNGPA